jgi:hypothetical protein
MYMGFMMLQMDIHMAEPLLTEPSLVEVVIAIGKLKRYKSLGTDWIPVEMIKAGSETYSNSKIDKLTRHEGVFGEWGYSSTSSLTSALDGDEWSASRLGRFTPRERALVLIG